MYPQSTPKPLTVVFPFNKSENFQSLDCLKYLDSNINLSLTSRMTIVSSLKELKWTLLGYVRFSF